VERQGGAAHRLEGSIPSPPRGAGFGTFKPSLGFGAIEVRKISQGQWRSANPHLRSHAVATEPATPLQPGLPAQDRPAQARTGQACDAIGREALQTMARDDGHPLSRPLSEVYELPQRGGYRQEIEESTRRGVLSDFLDMAARYLEELDYRTGATFAGILAGAVLEEYVRNLADANDIATTDSGGEPAKAEPLNAELRERGVYDFSEELQVRAWIELRNKAARAKRDEFTADEIRLMIQGLRDFMSRHPRS
jgi:hypothetical protein